MMDDILRAADLYADGLDHVRARRDAWLNKHKELRDHLKEVAAYLNSNTKYKQGFFVDLSQAFSEDNHGTCSTMPSVTFRSGAMSMLVTFKNTMGERKEYDEEGLRITFAPLITGQVIVMLSPHESALNKPEPEFSTIAVIDDPAELTMEIADEILGKAIEAAWYTSFTGIAERDDREEAAKRQQSAHTPIGFKRYETTEPTKQL